MVIKNIRLIDPANEVDKICNIYIGAGKIIKIEDVNDLSDQDSTNQWESVSQKEIVIKGNGLIAAPGFIDVHVHFRDPGQTHKEDIHTGAQAAIAGGYTSVVMMANTTPTIDNSHVLIDVLERAKREKLHIYSCVNATKGMQGKEVVDAEPLIDIGAVGITDDGKPILDENILRKVCSIAEGLDVPLSLHEEDPKYIKENGVNSGEAASNLGLTGSDRNAEISMVNRDIKIAEEIGVKLAIQHISTKEAVNLVREAKKRGSKIYAEATPHHFSLTDDAVAKHGTLAKMNPPLRKKEDMLAIRDGLSDGTIDMIATDHAPHAKEEKDKSFKEAPSGIIGLETALPLAITNLVNNKVLDLKRLIELMSVNPAKLYKLPGGSLGEGDIADIVIFNPNEDNVINDFKSKSKNSPFVGQKLNGKVKYTIVSGEVVFED